MTDLYRLTEVSLHTHDARRAERIAVVCVMLRACTDEPLLRRVAEQLAAPLVSAPSTGEDLSLACSVLGACCKRGVRLDIVASCLQTADSTRLWVVAELARASADAEEQQAISAFVAASDCLAHVAVAHVPAKCDVALALGLVGDVVAPAQLQQQVLAWLETRCFATAPGDFDRSCAACAAALGRCWDVDGSLLAAVMKSMVERLGLCTADAPPVAFALALFAMPSSVIAGACHVLVEQSAEIALADLAARLVYFPMRAQAAALFGGILAELQRRRAKEVLYRITFSGASLACLVLQLFVSSCRVRALELLETMLLGWQSSPQAFHLVLPALTHLVSYLMAERAFLGAMSAHSALANGKRRDINVSALQCSHAILAFEKPPLFDPDAPYNDVRVASACGERIDVLADLARVIYDQTQLHTGFFSSLHAPILRAIRPHLAAGYVCDLPLLRLRSWTRDTPSGGANAASGSSGHAGRLDAFRMGRIVTAAEDTAPRTPGLGVGLANLGNTCYLNSLVQALFHAGAFRNHVVASAASGPMHSELAGVFEMLQHSPKRSVTPHKLIAAVPGRFRQGEQQDVSEFGKSLLDVLERERKESAASWNGQTLARVQCGRCGAVSESAEPFSDLEVALPATDTASNGSVTVQALVEALLLRTEHLEGDNRFYCSKCNALVESTRSVDVSVAPALLMLTLLRFAFVDGKIQKLMRSIALTDALVLPVAVRNEDGTLMQRERKPYQLFAVIVHSGQSATHGHYYAYCRDLDCGAGASSWQLFNDASVRAATLEEIAGRAAPDTPYVLLYKAVDDDKISL